MYLASGLRPPPPASGSEPIGSRAFGPGPSRAFRVQGLRPCPLQLDQSHVGSLTLAERPQDPRRVLLPSAAGVPGPVAALLSPPL